MNTSEMSQIERTFYPGWLMVSQLRGGQEVRDGEGLYRRACRLVQEVKATLTEAATAISAGITWSMRCVPCWMRAS